MSNSSYSSKEYETVHHITSRIAHKVRFLQDESERNDLIEMIRRAAEFTGVQLLGWCIMINHFHILAFLPTPVPVADEEVIRRYGILKGRKAAAILEKEIAQLLSSDAGSNKVRERLDAYRKRMYSIASFMKIVKQWFSEEYNRRTGHKGTLWEGVYHDRVVPFESTAIKKCLAYIHLNPIRAAVCPTFDGYVWSSYSAFKRRDDVAVAGMRFVYDDYDEEGNALSLSLIAEQHEALLLDLLEKEKRRRAEEIALKRLHGYTMPNDPLTDDALIAQAQNYIEDIQKASINLRLQRDMRAHVASQRTNIDEEIVTILRLQQGMSVADVSEALSVPVPTLYRHFSRLRKRGVIEQKARGIWRST
jgi:REP element-mobilizing transposase RayT/DNA-binding transcriptional ArsR family regulator